MRSIYTIGNRAYLLLETSGLTLHMSCSLQAW